MKIIMTDAEESEARGETELTEEAGHTMKYIVRNNFETIGYPCESKHNTRESADAAAETMRREIADMVSAFEAPYRRDLSPVGYTSEIDAWKQARGIAGVEYDDYGDRTSDSPTTYGDDAGSYIASLAVCVEEDGK